MKKPKAGIMIDQNLFGYNFTIPHVVFLKDKNKLMIFEEINVSLLVEKEWDG
ncbi:MAG: hypothetical protein ACOC0C_08820 [Bacteroidota bacterium]